MSVTKLICYSIKYCNWLSKLPINFKFYLIEHYFRTGVNDNSPALIKKDIVCSNWMENHY